MFQKFKMKELITIAMMSAVLGVFFTFLDSLYNPISELLGPTFSGLTFGVYAMSALLAGYVIRKPGASFLGSVFASAINILTGSPYGIHIMVAGALQGLGAEVGYGICKYKRFNVLTFLLNGIFITLFVSTRDYFVFSLGANPIPVILTTLLVRLISVTVISYLLCCAISLALGKAGLMSKEKRA